MFQIYDMLQALQEPNINLSELLDMFHRVAFFQSLSNGEDTEIGRILQGVLKVIKLSVIVADKSMHALTNHAQSLLNHFFETASDTHDLAYGFHGRTDKTAYA